MKWEVDGERENEEVEEEEEEEYDIDQCDSYQYRVYLASIWGIGVDDELNLAMGGLTINPKFKEESDVGIQNGYSLI